MKCLGGDLDNFQIPHYFEQRFALRCLENGGLQSMQPFAIKRTTLIGWNSLPVWRHAHFRLEQRNVSELTPRHTLNPNWQKRLCGAFLELTLRHTYPELGPRLCLPLAHNRECACKRQCGLRYSHWIQWLLSTVMEAVVNNASCSGSQGNALRSPLHLRAGSNDSFIDC